MDTTKTTTKRRKWRSKPGLKRETKWQYGKDSELLLCIKIAGNYLPNIASIDVRNKYRAPGPGNDYTQARKIELLKALFEKGGMKGNSFNPTAVEFAAICPNESGTGMADLRKALLIWKPGAGWTPNVKPPQASAPSAWRAWMAGHAKPETMAFEKLKADHAGFCTRFLEKRPDILGRYVDQENGEIPAGFLIAAHLAEEAMKIAQTGSYHRCYIYNSNSSTAVCRVDLGTGRLMGFGTGNGWINPAVFQNM